MTLRELPARESDRWTNQHYSVRLRYQGRSMRLPFQRARSDGPAPNVDQVLKCLLDDAAVMINQPGLEDWAGELGYDPSEPGTPRMYARVQAQTGKLETLLGEDFHQYLWGSLGPELTETEFARRIQQAQARGEMGSFGSLQEMSEREGWDGGLD
jgi:hypothetical protein